MKETLVRAEQPLCNTPFLCSGGPLIYYNEQTRNNYLIGDFTLLMHLFTLLTIVHKGPCTEVDMDAEMILLVC